MEKLERAGRVVPADTTQTEGIIANILSILHDILPENVVQEGKELLAQLDAAHCAGSADEQNLVKKLDLYYNRLHELLFGWLRKTNE